MFEQKDIVSYKEIEWKQVKEIVKKLQINNIDLTEPEMYKFHINITASRFVDDGQTDYWSWDEIIKRYNRNYGQNYEIRKLRDGFKKALSELDDEYHCEHPKESWSLLDEFKMGGSYYFPKKNMNLYKKYKILEENLLEEELDDLCEIFYLCLPFSDKKRQSVGGIVRLGKLLGMRDNKIVGLGSNAPVRFDQRVMDMVRCYVKRRFSISELQIRIGEKLKGISPLKEGDKEEIKKFLEGNLNEILDRYDSQAITMIEDVKLLSICQNIMEKASIRTYTDRGTNGKTSKSSMLAVNLNELGGEAIDFSIDKCIAKIRKIKKNRKSNSAASCIDRLEAVKKQFEDRTEGNKRVLNELEIMQLKNSLKDDLIAWLYRADCLEQKFIGYRMMERIQYCRKNNPKGITAIIFDKKTGELLPSSLEEEFCAYGKRKDSAILWEEIKKE